MAQREDALLHLHTSSKDEVDDITAQLARAEAHDHDRSPIHALPNELLIEIFERLAYSNGYGTEGRYWGWVTITHVCQRFRAVALGHASLWAVLTLDEHLPFALFLSRSQNIPLDVRCNANYHRPYKAWVDQFQPHLRQNFGRVRRLDVNHHGATEPRVNAWLAHLHEDAPEMHSLTLILHPSRRRGREIDPEFVPSKAPQLTMLNLGGVQMPWNITAPANLESLVLESSFRDSLSGDTAYTFSQVVRSLQNLPLLQNLSLRSSLALSDMEVHGPANDRITLPHLRRLILLDHDERCLLLWGALDIPPTCKVTVDVTDAMSDECAALFIACFERHLMRAACPIYQRVEIEGDSDDDEEAVPSSVQLTLYTTRGDQDDVLKYRDGPYIRRWPHHEWANYRDDLEPTLHVAFLLEGRTDLLCSLIALIPSEHVQTLWLSERIGPFGVHFTRLVSKALRHFNATKVLSISGKRYGKPCRLVRAFGACLRAQCERRTTDTFLPALDTLYLETFPFSRDSKRVLGRRMSDTISTFLQSRATDGRPLRTLRIFGDEISGVMLETWRRWVEEVSSTTRASDNYSSDDYSSESEENVEERNDDGVVSADEVED